MNRKRKKIILAIAAVCLIALAAEGALLWHTFAAKGEKAKAKPTEAVTKKASPTPSPLPTLVPFQTVEVPEGYRAEWRVATATFDGDLEEITDTLSFSYDEYAREVAAFYEKDGKLTARHRIQYDKNGTQKEVWTADGTGTEYLQYVYFTDNVGEDESIYVTWGEEWTCVYDEKGNREQLIRYACAGPGGVHDTNVITEWVYDSKGLIRERLERSGPPGEETLTARNVYEYDREGRISKITFYTVLSGGVEREDATSSFTYDGERTTEVREYYGNKVENVTIGSFTESTVYYMKDGNGRMEYEYFPLRDFWEPVYRAGLSVPTGLPVRETEIDGTGARTEYIRATYDETGRIVEIYGKDIDYNGEERLSASLTYDEHGKLTELVFRPLNRSARSFVTYEETRYSFTYDDYGNLIEEREYYPETEQTRIVIFEWNCIFVQEQPAEE